MGLIGRRNRTQSSSSTEFRISNESQSGGSSGGGGIYDESGEFSNSNTSTTERDIHGSRRSRASSEDLAQHHAYIEENFKNRSSSPRRHKLKFFGRLSRRFSAPNVDTSNDLNASTASIGSGHNSNGSNSNSPNRLPNIAHVPPHLRPTPQPLRRGRRNKRHTIDTTVTDVVKPQYPQQQQQQQRPQHLRSHPSTPGSTTGAEGEPNKNVLMKFLANNRRKSQNSGASGSTVSRLTDDGEEILISNQQQQHYHSDARNHSTSPSPPVVTRTPRRATMDMELTDPSPSVRAKSPTSTTPMSSTLPSSVQSSGGSRGGRRATMDLGISSTHKRSTDTIVLEPNDYQSAQDIIQRQADDFHKSGQLDLALEKWQEALELAEDNQDTLASKTELRCILIDTHLQLADQSKQASQYQYDDSPNHDPEDAERQARYHKQAAKRYVHRIKPSVVKPSWLGAPTKRLVEFFVEAEAWEFAVMIADQLYRDTAPGRRCVIESQALATMHYQVASQKLDQHRQGEALQHLQSTVKHLQKVSARDRDMTMYLQVLQLLGTEYLCQDQHALALEAFEEQLAHSPEEQKASIYCQMANVYIATKKLDLALEKLQSATTIRAVNDTDQSDLRLQLLQTKGDVYYRLGRMEESLLVYQQALEEVVNPAEKAKLLYTLGRLCIRLKRIRLAVSYFSLELEITQQELGEAHLSCSRILHELAKLYDEGLGDQKMALMKLNKALHIELSVLQECHFAITQCQKCNPITHRMCSMHANIQKDIAAQIRETKKAQGRIHFKLGDFEKALKASFQQAAGKK